MKALILFLDFFFGIFGRGTGRVFGHKGGRIFVLALLFAAPSFATMYDTSDGRAITTGNGATLIYPFTFPAGATADVQATVLLAGVVQGNLYSVSLNSDQINNPGGSVTFTVAPANTSIVTIQRTENLTQGTVLNPYVPFPAKTVERTFDSTVRKIQQVDRRVADLEAKETADISNTIAGGVAAASLLAPIATGTPASRTEADRWADFRNVRDWNANPGAGDVSGQIQSAINAGKGTIFFPASTSCYNIGSTTLNLSHGVILQGSGHAGPSSGASCITYSGTGCAILMDSTVRAGFRHFDLQVNTASATAIGICVLDTTGTAEFNLIEYNAIKQTNAVRRVGGQVGILLKVANNHGVYWNTLRTNVLAYWDKSIRLIGQNAPNNGANDNVIDDTMSWGHNTAMEVVTRSNDNTVTGLRCSRSDATHAGVATCLLVGDNSGDTTLGNSFFHVVSDQAGGAGSVCATIGQSAGATVLYTGCESGGPVTDNNATGSPNFIWEGIAGATPGRLRAGRIDATVEASSPLRKLGTFLTCTTAAAVGAACTTGIATWSPAFSDIAWRGACTLNTITSGQPHIVSINKISGSQFTLTIAADTAVAAAGSFDCIAEHP